MIKIGNTLFNLDVKEMSLEEFKNTYKGKLNYDLEKAYKILNPKKKKK